MFKSIRNHKNIFRTILVNKKRTFLLLGGNFLANLVAVFLEISTFTFILLAFASINGEEQGAVSTFSFLSTFEFTSYANELSNQQAFIFYITLGITSQVFKSLMGIIALHMLTVLNLQVTRTLETKVYSQIFRFDFPFVSQYKIGDLTEYIKIPQVIITNLSKALNDIALSGFIILGSLFVLFKLNALLTVVMFFIFGLFLFGQKFFVRSLGRHSKQLVSDILESSKIGVQSLHAMRPIHIFHKHDEILSAIKELIKKIAKTNRVLSLNQSCSSAVAEVGSIALVGVCFIIGTMLFRMDSALMLPVMVTYLGIIHRLGMRVQSVAGGLAGFAANSGYLFRLEEVLKTEDKEYIKDGNHVLEKFSDYIEFRDVNLRYKDQSVSAVQDLSFKVKKGNMIALVGHSGAGKSSVIDLLLRLYDVSSGGIYVDGIKLQDLDLRSWRRCLGVVSQDTFIFNTTIEENIKFGSSEATLEEIKTVCVLSGADEFIQKLPQGYNTLVGERGYRLSGGERQRIAIARALLKKPDILVLDEATSSLDSESELLIQNALANFYGKKTIISIAHRLSTITQADQIFLIENGSIQERGRHEELLEKKGKYARLWDIQAKGHRKKKSLKELSKA